ncbi:MAG: Arm DNA-binding domain-containing protein [Giesbergeria sp.]
MRDTKAPGLRVRVTAAGAKSYVFEAKLNRQTIRRTLGDVRTLSIEDARDAARTLAKTVKTDKQDPREVQRQQQAAQAASKAAAAVQAVTVGEVWTEYLTERRPQWGERHYQDHIDKAAPGGVASTRRGYEKHLTKPGPLAALMPLPLRDLDAPTIEAWAAKEAKTRATSARLAWRLLKVFLALVRGTTRLCWPAACKEPGKDQKEPRSIGQSRGEKGRSTA